MSKTTKPPSHEAALWQVVTAWEALPTGHYSPDTIQRWLSKEMKPAIDAAREALGRIGDINPPVQWPR